MSESKKAAIDLLLVEYGTLRTEIMSRAAGRFQIVGYMAAAVALLANAVSLPKAGQEASGPTQAGQAAAASSQQVFINSFVFGVVVALLVVGFAFWWVGGRLIDESREHIKCLEKRISNLALSAYDEEDLLKWQRTLPKRSWWQRFMW